jgi:hypothetical protein
MAISYPKLENLVLNPARFRTGNSGSKTSRISHPYLNLKRDSDIRLVFEPDFPAQKRAGIIEDFLHG